mgnify:CR=1 FL=1|tara:strand:+ start:157 stop:630 length:474 start_codon:yes stop_codon:yes gene_type:complete
MEKVITPILIGLLIGAAGFFVGQHIGYENGIQTAERMHKLRSIDEIKSELKGREAEDISSHLKGKAGIKNIDEGFLFEVKYVQYFSGSLTNSATIASAKDVKLNVDFFSKTGAKIGNQEITIYEFIRPGRSIKFKEKINFPAKAEDFKFQIIEAKSE